MSRDEYNALVAQKFQAWRRGHMAQVAEIERRLLGLE